MNKIFRKTIMCLGFATIAAGFAACDDVPEGERLVEVPRGDVARKVLIMEFTGQRCPNCPEGAAAVKEIEETYPGSIISINMHPKGPSFTRPLGGLKLISDIATVMYNHYRPATFPAAVIDGASPLTTTTLWAGKVSTDIELPAVAEISLETYYDMDSRKLTVKYKADFNKLHSGELNMCIWITESGVVGPQDTNGNRINDYVHNHIARTTLTGDWGVSMGSSFAKYQIVEGEVSCTLDESWVAENCHVVGFIQNPSSKIVEQVEQVHLIPSADD